MNAIDFIVTIAIGSAYGRILTTQEVSVSEAITAFFTLIVIQYIISKVEVHFRKLTRKITPQPRLLFYKGHFCNKNLKKKESGRKNYSQYYENIQQQAHMKSMLLFLDPVVDFQY